MSHVVGMESDESAVPCVRCWVAEIHPNGHYPRICPNCGQPRRNH